MVINRDGLKSYLNSWVFTTMQSVHIRMNSSLSPHKKSWIRLCTADLSVKCAAGHCKMEIFIRNH